MGHVQGIHFLSKHPSQLEKDSGEFSVNILFGMFGGIFFSQLGIFTIGINLGSMVSSLLGANVVDIIAKKFGFSRKMEVIVYITNR